MEKVDRAFQLVLAGSFVPMFSLLLLHFKIRSIFCLVLYIKEELNF